MTKSFNCRMGIYEQQDYEFEQFVKGKLDHSKLYSGKLRNSPQSHARVFNIVTSHLRCYELIAQLLI